MNKIQKRIQRVAKALAKGAPLPPGTVDKARASNPLLDQLVPPKEKE